MNKFPHIFGNSGPLVSSRYWSNQDRQDTEVFYHHKEKSECALVALSSWYGGDVFEFGSHDLCTARNILTALDISGMARQYPDTRFYFFDIFGKLEKDVGDLALYFKPYSDQGDRLAQHQAMLNEHGLFTGKTHLIQGLFADTLTQEFKEKWRNDNPDATDRSKTALHLPEEYRNSSVRQIGYCSIDCNVPSSYKTVFEWVFDALAPNSYVYLDEGLQSPEAMHMWSQFTMKLIQKRGIATQYIRNAGGFGVLYRLYPVSPYELNL